MTSYLQYNFQKPLVIVVEAYHHTSGILAYRGARAILNMSRTRNKAVSEGIDPVSHDKSESGKWGIADGFRIQKEAWKKWTTTSIE